MSDLPPSTPDIADSKSSQPNGGWRTPQAVGVWRAPDQAEEEAEGWRVPTLPENMSHEPEQVGDWHLPKDEDTVFTPEDEVEVRETKRPEDELWDMIPADSMSPAPEDALLASSSAEPVVEAPPPAPLAPEDLMYLIEHSDEAGDDDESVPMSELIALASLVDSNVVSDAQQGKESHISADFALSTIGDQTDADLPTEILSPAERLIMQPTEAVDAELVLGDDDLSGTTVADPAAYARQQLAQLSGAAPALGAGDAVDDPAAYARQQLAQLGGDASDYTPAPQITEPVDPRQLELASQFNDVEEKVRSLRQQMNMGQITQDQFVAQLRNMMILDDHQNWWMMGVESDTWYKSDNNQWVEAVPPPLMAQREQAARSGRSLSYLPEDSQPPSSTGYDSYGEYTPPDTGGIQLDQYNMPLPREAPITDPQATVPSASAFDFESEPSPYDATVPSATIRGSSYQPTVMATPVNYGSTIESAIDATEPPDYDYDESGDIYEDARRRQQQSLGRLLAIAGIIGTVLLLLGAAAFIGVSLLWYNGIVDEWKGQITALGDFQPEFQTVKILDTNGIEIASLGREGDDRRPVELSEVSPYFIHAVISLENERFYNDPGWDLFAILRAFGQNITSGSIESGASTITQQVARNLVLQNSEVSTGRKINEVVVAGELTRRYTKDEILELYLNEVLFFGNQTYGVEAAAQFYFGKSAADLTMPEAAFLASIPSDPVNNEPVTNRQRALDLMRVTMQRMADVGCIKFQHEPYNGADFCVTDDMITSDETILQIALVESKNFKSRQFGVRYPHFTQLVQAQLENIFGANEIYSRGYVVTTTLDSRLQDQAQNAVVQRVDALSTNGINTGAALVVDPRNGAILALVGSPDFNDAEIDGQVDNTRTFQQPGSSIKPIEYTAALTGFDRNGNGALDAGEYFTPATILWDVPTTYQGNPPYIPQNFDRQFRGPVSVRTALQNSLNVPAVKTYEFIGNDVFRATAEAMGLRFVENAEFNLTTGVGSTDVRLIDMVRAFGVLANNGRRVELYTIQNIVDSDGNPVGIPPREEPQQVVSPDIAYLMQNILSDDQARAPQFGLNSNLTIQGLPTQNVVAVKTGTTDQSRDLWTMGFTNNRVVGVWLGTVDNTPTFNTTGFTAAAPVWNTIMRAALENNPPTGFSAPGNGTVVNRQICRDTGTLPASNCANIANEIFAANRPPPSAESGLVATLQVDSWTGLIANEFCPDNVIEATFANITDPSAVNWINSTAAGQAYAQRVGIQLPISPAPQLACNQNTPIPVARITTPQGGQTVQGNVAIIGQVSAEGFNRYQLEIASLATPESFQIVDNFSTTQQPNAGSTLANWNTMTVPNGGYILRLAAFSENGGYVYRTTQVTVNNPAATATPIIPTQAPIPIVPTEPLPFDPLVTPFNSQEVPVGPTPTIDPLG